MPELVKLQEEMADEGVRVVAVSFDLKVPVAVTDPEGILAFARERGFDSLEIVALEGDVDDLDPAWGFSGALPHTFVLDRTGAVVDREEGAAGYERFTEMARGALR